MSAAEEHAGPRDWDAIEGVEPPRMTRAVIGHEAQERVFLDAWAAGRVHHAWLITGPRGIGKASLAYRIARFALGRPPEPGVAAPDSLDAAPGAEAAARQIAAGAHPGLTELRRGWNEKTKKFKSAIAVDDVRKLIGFFHLSAAEGGWRVAIVDPADDLNTAAANALLKALEEPPERALFLIVSHAPGRLPATILSRCRRLACGALSAGDAARAAGAAAPALPPDAATALARLSGGAPGEALRLWAMGGMDRYDDIVRLLIEVAGGRRRIDRGDLARFADSAAARGKSEQFETTARLFPMALERLAKASLGAVEPATPAEQALFERAASGIAAAQGWAELAVGVADRLGAAVGLNLDPRRAILDIALYLEAEAPRPTM